jgi:hypothetical protein
LPVSAQIAAGREPGVELVEGGENVVEGFFVGCLGLGESGPVDAIVELVVNQAIEFVDFCAIGLGLNVVRIGADLIKGTVEHADDVG